MPETVVCERADDAMAAVRAMGDVVIKPIFGSMGHGMVRVSDPDVAFRVVRALDQMRSVFYVQRAIDHGGRDLRVFVVGGACSARSSGELRQASGAPTSPSAAPRRPFDMPAEWEQLALRAAAAVGADYAGVDLLPARDGSRLRARGQRHPRMGGAAAGDRSRRCRRHRRASRACSAAGRRTVRRRACRYERRLPRTCRGAPGSRSRSSAPQRGCRRAAGVPARSERAEAGQRVARPSLRRPAIRRFPGQRRCHRRAAGTRRRAQRRRNDPAGDRSHRTLDALEHQSRHRAAARAAGSSRVSCRDRDLQSAAERACSTATTVDDARDVYAAIRLARPGGLGRAEAQDVADGADDDAARGDAAGGATATAIAREYATGFEMTFGMGVPALERARRDGLAWDDAVVETFLTLLAADPGHAHRASRRRWSRRGRVGACPSRARGGRRSIRRAGGGRSTTLDRGLRDARNSGNPGTTADLTAAAIFVVLARRRICVDLRHGGSRSAFRRDTCRG